MLDSPALRALATAPHCGFPPPLRSPKPPTVAPEAQRVLDSALVPLLSVDAKGRIQQWNLCLEALSGYLKSEVWGT